MALSHLAETLIGSEIIKLAAEVNERIAQGNRISNFTIGDFDPQLFPIPERFKTLIKEAYDKNQTNYPAAEGIPALRKAIAGFIKHYQGLDYRADEILVASGGRPVIYAAYRTLVNPGNKVIYAVPSWNNNHYTHFVDGDHIAIETRASDNFMLTAAGLKPLIKGAALITLCSPQNPTGTTFSYESLKEICELVVEENKRRDAGDKKLYILFDQIYWMLCYGDHKHHDPVSICPELKEYCIFVDGMSKSFASTGVRVGWSMGPPAVMAKMKSILSHIGAWSPMPEQQAAAIFLTEFNEVDAYLGSIRSRISSCLEKIHNGIQDLRGRGLPVDSIAPEAAIYLTVKLNLLGRETKNDGTLATPQQVFSYILEKAALALVPFSAFGTSSDSPWFRLSVGTCKEEEIDAMITRLRLALEELS